MEKGEIKEIKHHFGVIAEGAVNDKVINCRAESERVRKALAGLPT